MSKIDSHARRRELGEALWRVVVREGIEAASVRKVAAEAGVSAGSLRHVFPSQSELLTFAMQLIVDEVASRVAAVDESGAVRQTVEQRLRTLLVLDPESRAVFDVWLAFATRACVDESLRPLRDETHARVRALCRESLEALTRRTGRRGPGSTSTTSPSASTASSTASRCMPPWPPRRRQRRGRSTSSAGTWTA